MIERDTGYSVNNSDDGIRDPSIPELYRGGKWAHLGFERKLSIVRKPMESGRPPFHRGHHAIADPDDPDQIRPTTYDSFLKKSLAAMDDGMPKYAERCPRCEP